MLARRQHLLLQTPLALVLLPFLVAPALLGLFSSFTDYAPVKPQTSPCSRQDIVKDGQLLK